MSKNEFSGFIDIDTNKSSLPSMTERQEIKNLVQGLIEEAEKKISNRKRSVVNDLLKEQNVPEKYDFVKNKKKLEQKLISILTKNKDLKTKISEKYLTGSNPNFNKKLRQEVVLVINKELEKYHQPLFDYFNKDEEKLIKKDQYEQLGKYYNNHEAKKEELYGNYEKIMNSYKPNLKDMEKTIEQVYEDIYINKNYIHDTGKYIKEHSLSVIKEEDPSEYKKHASIHTSKNQVYCFDNNDIVGNGEPINNLNKKTKPILKRKGLNNNDSKINKEQDLNKKKKKVNFK